MFTSAIITISDRASSGVYEDKTGPALVEMLNEAGYEVREVLLIPDEKDQIEAAFIRLAEEKIALMRRKQSLEERKERQDAAGSLGIVLDEKAEELAQ